MRIGVDTGGTFTDFVAQDQGRIRLHKVSSTPRNPAEAVCRGIAELCQQLRPRDEVIHGTTVATNGFLERRGARTALITTRGFRDLLFIGRQNRPELYNFRVERPAAFIKRSWVFQLPERTLADGSIACRPPVAKINHLGRRLRLGRFRSIAVAFLHSYANPANEQLVARELQALAVPLSVSSDILPEFREYERLSTTCINAYLEPLLGRYLTELKERLRPARLQVQQSAGGHTGVPEAVARPVHTILSGPAGGLVGARKMADLLGEMRIITFDMGGTSTDVALSEGELPYTREYQLDGYPLGIQVLDIHTIGAGGGSIAWIDRGGALRVGPRSAGADPGPACYGKGREPTVTDAHLFLGRLLPDYFLGGRLPLHPERSRQAIQALAQRLGLSPLQAAEGIIAVANANMSRALRAVSLERGHDPRRYLLVCLGGAAGLHACELALELNIERIILPWAAGVLSALGMVTAPRRRDLSRTVLLPEEQLQEARLGGLFGELDSRGRIDLAAAGMAAAEFTARRQLDVRYQGQAYEITVPHGPDFIEAFHRRHQRLFGHAFFDRKVEVTTLRLTLEGPPPDFTPPGPQLTGKGGWLQRRRLYCAGSLLEAPVVSRTALIPGQPLAGPALVVDENSTCLVTPDFVARTDSQGSLHLERKG